MKSLKPSERALLRSTWQRPRLFFARFGVFKTKTYTVTRDATEELAYHARDWRPILNIGPHRIAFVGEEVTFDALDSYHISFDGKGKHRRAHAQGYGVGRKLGRLDWRIKDANWKRLGEHWEKPQTWTPTEAGLYELTCESREVKHQDDVEKYEKLKGKERKDQAIRANLDTVSRRWIRVYEDRESAQAHGDVVEINGLTGEWGGGWSCTLTIRDENIDLEDTTINDYQAIGIYCEDSWYVGPPDNTTAMTPLRPGIPSSPIEWREPVRNGVTHAGDIRALATAEELAWRTQSIGQIRQDPRLVMVGYVKEGSIQKDAETKTVTITLESITGQLDRSMIHKLAIWEADGPEDERENHDEKKKAGKSGRHRKHRRKKNRHHRRRVRRRRTRDDRHRNKHKHRRRRRRRRRHHRHDERRDHRGQGGGGKGGKKDGGSEKGGDSWGAILRGFGRVSVPDFATWMLMFKTNVLEMHDFYTAWNDDLADLESIAGEEGSVLSNLATVGANDWYIAGADAGNALYFAPDRQVMKDDDWEDYWPVRMTLTDRDIWDLEFIQQYEDPIKFVKLTATKVADFTSDAKSNRKRRIEEKRNQLEATYPSKEPPLHHPGAWFVRSDLLHDNRRVLRRRAKQVYIVQNLTWTGRVTMGLNRAIAPGYVVTIDTSTSRNLFDGEAKNFLVTGMSVDMNMENQTWQTTLNLQEWNDRTDDDDELDPYADEDLSDEEYEDLYE